MELFKVTCVTCRARLSVRDAALVGQIVGCPRCGMMVQVMPPPAGVGEVALATDVSIVTTPSVEASTYGRAALPSSDAAPPPPPAANSFDDAAEAISDHAVEPAGPPPASPVAAAAAASRPLAYKFAAMIAGGAIAGSGLVVLALSLLSRGPDSSTSAPAAAAAALPAASPSSTPPGQPSTGPNIPPASPELASSAASTADPGLALTNDAREPFEAAAAEDAPPAAPDDAATLDSSDSSAPPSAPATAQLDSPAAVASAPAAVESVAPSVPAAATSGETPASAPPTLRIDPLNVDPEGLSLVTLYNPPTADPLAQSQLPADSPAESAASNAESSAPPAEAAARAAQVVRRDADAGLGAPVATAPLLARKLANVKFAKMPLCRLLDFATQTSGLPVSAPPHELRMAGVSAASPASADLADATIEQLLAQALKPLRLEPVVVDEQIVLRRSGEDRRRTIDYAVDDLAATVDEAEQLGRWIERLATPESWEAAGGSGALQCDGRTLRITQAESVQYDVLLLLERYRLARSLGPRSKYPAALVAPAAPTLAMLERLSGPATFTFTDYAPLREIFRYWQEELGVAVLVDWPALAGERLWPSARIACAVADRPWAEALDEVLRPMNLGWRAVDGRTLQITTLAKVRSEPQVDIYKLADNASIDAETVASRIAQSAREAQPPASPAAETAAPDAFAAPVVVYDADHRVLLIRQPAIAHRRTATALADLLVPPAK